MFAESSLFTWLLQPSYYWIVSPSIKGFLCTYLLNHFVTSHLITPTSGLLSPTSTSRLPHRHPQNKLLKCNQKDPTMPLYSCMILITHSRILAPKPGDVYNHHRRYIECRQNFSLKTRQVLSTVIKLRPCNEYGGKSILTWFFLQLLSHTSLPAPSREDRPTAGLPWQLAVCSCQRSENC